MSCYINYKGKFAEEIGNHKSVKALLKALNDYVTGKKYVQIKDFTVNSDTVTVDFEQAYFTKDNGVPDTARLSDVVGPTDTSLSTPINETVTGLGLEMEEIDIESISAVKYQTFKSTSHRDVEKGSIDFTPNPNNEATRYYAKIADRKSHYLKMVNDKEEYGLDPTLSKDKVGHVLLLMDKKTQRPVEYKGKIYGFNVQRYGAFFGQDENAITNVADYIERIFAYLNAGEVEIPQAYLEEKPRVLYQMILDGKAPLLAEVHNIYKAEQAQMQAVRDTLTTDEDFAIFNINGGGDGVYPFNDKPLSELDFELVSDNFEINYETGATTVEIKTPGTDSGVSIEVPVYGSKLSKAEAKVISENIADEELVSIILGINNSKKVSGNSFRYMKGELKFIYNDESVKSYSVNDGESLYKFLTEGDDKYGKKTYRRNLSKNSLKRDPAYLRKVNVARKLKKKDPLTSQELFRASVIPAHGLYKFEGEYSEYPASKYINIVKPVVNFSSYVDKKTTAKIVTVDSYTDGQIKALGGKLVADNTPAFYSHSTHTIVNKNATPSQILEEQLHSITVDWLKKNTKSDEYRQLNDLFLKAKETANLADPQIAHSFKDIYEFVARGVSHEATINHLKGIETNGSFFNKVKEAVKVILKIIGIIPNNAYTTLQDFVINIEQGTEVTDAIVQDNEEIDSLQEFNPLTGLVKEIHNEVVNNDPSTWTREDIKIKKPTKAKVKKVKKKKARKSKDDLFGTLGTLGTKYRDEKVQRDSLDSLFVSFLNDLGASLIDLNEKGYTIDIHKEFLIYLYNEQIDEVDSPLWDKLFVIEDGEVLEDEDGNFLIPDTLLPLIQVWHDKGKIFNINKDVLEQLEVQEDIAEAENKEDNTRNVSFDRKMKSLFAEADADVRNFFRTFHGTEVNELGIKKLLNNKDLYVKVFEKINGSQGMSEMFRRLPGDGIFGQMKLRLGNPREATGNKLILWLKMHRVFQSVKSDVLKLKEFDNGGVSVIQETGSNTGKIQQQWQSDWNRIMLASGDGVVNDLNEVVASEAYVDKIIAKIEDSDNSFVDAIDIWTMLGVTFTTDVFTNSDKNAIKNFLTNGQAKKSIIKFLKANKNSLHSPVAQIKGRGKGMAGELSSINFIINTEAKYSELTMSLMALNANNDKQLGATLVNTATQLINQANKKKFKNTPLSRASIITKLITGGARIDPVNYNGYETPDSNSTTSGLNEKQWTKMNIYTMLKKGMAEILRPETASSAWAIQVSIPKEKNYKWVESTGEKALKSTVSQYGNYYEAEVENRLNSADKVHLKNYSGNEWNYFYFLPYYTSDGGEFKLYSDFITHLANNIEVTEVIKPYEEIAPLVEQYLRNQITENLARFTEVGLTEADFGDLDYKNLADIANDFTLNNLIYNVETTILLFDGVQNFSKFYKRNKGVFSTGNTPPTDNWWWERQKDIDLRYDFSSPWTKTYNLREDSYDLAKEEMKALKKGFLESYIIRNKVLKLGLTQKRIKEIADAKFGAYNGMEIADGQGYVNIHFMRVFLQGVGNWNKKDEALYRWEASYYIDVVTGNISKEYYLANNPRPNHNFTSLKTQYFGNPKDSDITIFDKFSLKPLLPSVMHNRKAEALMTNMMDNNIGYAKFGSAQKGQQHKGDTEYGQVPIMGENRENISMEGEYKQTYEVYAPLMKEQLVTNTKVKQENIFGSQFRKLVAQDLKTKNGFTSKKAGELYNRYVTSLDNITAQAEQELFKKLGIKDGQFENFEALLKELEKDALDRELGKAVIDFINLNRGKSELEIPFEASSNKQTIRNTLQGIFNRKLIRQKINGPQLIQVAPSGYESKDDLSTGLKYYDWNNGAPIAAEARIPMSKNFKPLLKKYGSLEALNEALKDNPVHIIGYRIPTQGLSSMDVFSIKEFLPEQEGNIIIPPPEIVAKSGADYDIDKMSFIFPKYGYDGEIITNGLNPTKHKAKVDSLLENIETYKGDIASLNEEFDQLKELLELSEEEFKELKKSLREFNKLYFTKIQLEKTIGKDKIKKIKNEIAELNKKRSEFYVKRRSDATPEQVEGWNKYTDLIIEANAKFPEGYQELLKELDEVGQYLPDLNTSKVITAGNKMFKDFSSSKSLLYLQLQDLNKRKEDYQYVETNNLVKTLSEMILLPENFHQLVTPLGTDIIEPQAKLIAEILDKEKDDTRGRVIEWGTHSDKRNALLGAMRLLGIAATATTYLQLFQQGLVINRKRHKYPLLSQKAKKGELDYRAVDVTDQYNDNKDLKSEVSNQYVNGTVDAASNDFLGKINFTIKNMGVIMYSNLIGVDQKIMMNFINQPILRDLTKEQDKGTRGAINELAKKAGAPMKGKGVDWEAINVPENYHEQISKFDGDTKEGREELENLLKNGINPLATLKIFKQMSDDAGELFLLQKGLNFDTNPAQTPLDSIERQASFQAARNSELFTKESVDKVKANIPTRSLDKDNLFIDLMMQVFPYQFNKEFLDFAIGFKKDLMDGFGDEKILDREGVDKFYRVLSNDFLSYLIVNKVPQDADKLLKMFPAVFRAKKKELSHYNIINDLVIDKNKRLEDGYLYLDLKSLEADDMTDIYTEELEELYANPDTRDFTRRLVAQGFFQDGFNKSFYSWGRVIPPAILLDIIGKDFKDVNLDTFDWGQFRKDFLANNGRYTLTEDILWTPQGGIPNMKQIYDQESGQMIMVPKMKVGFTKHRAKFLKKKDQLEKKESLNIINKPAPGVETINTGLSLKKANSFIDLLAPFIKTQAYTENAARTANKMFSIGLRWSRTHADNVTKLNKQQLLNNKEVLTFGEKPNRVKINQKEDRAYGYFSHDQNGNLLPPMSSLDPIRKHIEESLGIDLSDYDAVLANIYEEGSFIHQHRDTTESATAENYPVVVVNLGADGKLVYDKNTSSSYQTFKGDSSISLKNGSIYAFGVNGVDRFKFHHRIANTLDSETKTKPITLPDGSVLDNYRITLTFRRAKDLEAGIPSKPSRNKEQVTNTPVEKYQLTPEQLASLKDDNKLDSDEVNLFGTIGNYTDPIPERELDTQINLTAEQIENIKDCS